MYRYADLHADTLFECFDKKISLNNDALQISISKLGGFDMFLQTFAHFIPEKIDDKWNYLTNFLNHSRAILFNNNIKLYNGKSSLPNRCAVFSVEGGDVFDTPEQALDRLSFLKKNGFLFFSLIYNNTNRLGCGAKAKDDFGLTKLGTEIAPLIEKAGMIIDISHASFRSAEQLLQISEMPVCATHSNCYKITNHSRNLPDKFLRLVADSGGLVGLNFYPPFLHHSGKANMENIAEHLNYMIDLCGTDHVALGCDFDGIEIMPEGISGVDSLPYLFCYLKEKGFTNNILDKVFFDNVYNFVQNVRR